MLFNSYEFIFAFLPVVLVGFYLFSQFTTYRFARWWLVASSLFFYGWWKPIYLPLLVTSAIVNYLIGTTLGKRHFIHTSARKTLLILGITGNLSLLGYFKYTNFFLQTANSLLGLQLPYLPIILPLAISFFTFQKIGYLVDSYYRKTEGYAFSNYLLFVSFFPQLIAGPIVHHKEIITQFEKPATYQRHWEHLAKGLSVFLIGLAKKTAIADTLAVWATNGFDHLVVVSPLQAWTSTLCYTLQLYFDFSGYTDMAIGAALLFNIRLPENFDSPYQANHIREFWRKWHMTLSRFLRDYVYIPLGGNRASGVRSAANMILTFLIGGWWHGAAWTFVVWGLYHGVGIVIQSSWEKFHRPLPPWLARSVTFIFVLVGWVFFRAKSWDVAVRFLKAMVGWAPNASGGLLWLNSDPNNSLEFATTLLILVMGILIVFLGPNTRNIQARLRPTWRAAAFVSGASLMALVCSHHVSEFLYFNF